MPDTKSDFLKGDIDTSYVIILDTSGLREGSLTPSLGAVISLPSGLANGLDFPSHITCSWTYRHLRITYWQVCFQSARRGF
jgi:hypothetical protein